jgi:hypothetical protein
MANERSEFTNKEEDVSWVLSTHLRQGNVVGELTPKPKEIKSFIFFGNADCPTKICLYKKKSPLLSDKPTRYLLTDTGQYKKE